MPARSPERYLHDALPWIGTRAILYAACLVIRAVKPPPAHGAGEGSPGPRAISLTPLTFHPLLGGAISVAAKILIDKGLDYGRLAKVLGFTKPYLAACEAALLRLLDYNLHVSLAELAALYNHPL